MKAAKVVSIPQRKSKPSAPDSALATLKREAEIALNFSQRHLFKAPPGDIPLGELGGVSFLVIAFKRLVEKRYGVIREELIARAKAHGKRAEDGRLFLRAGDFDVPISVTPKGLVAPERLREMLVAVGMKPSRIAKIVLGLPSENAQDVKCPTCKGRGHVPAPLGRLRIDEHELAKIVNAEILREEDVRPVEYRLGDIRPPASLQRALEALEDRADGP